MSRSEEPVELTPTEARGAETNGSVRYILFVSLGLAVLGMVLLGAVFI